MRGGALFQLAWGSILAAFLVGCWIWTGDALQTGEFGFGVAMTWGGALLVIARGRREALRRGEPAASAVPTAVPSSSLASVLVAIGFASILFGFTFGRFLVFFGAGLTVTALGMLVLERRQERQAVRAFTEREAARR